MSRKPIIGITKPESKRMNLSFIVHWIALWLAGSRPKITSYDEEVKNQNYDALMLGGGTDIFPGLFFKDPKLDYAYDHKRDDLEIRLLKKAQKEGLPVMAICRGSQLMNVVNGGTVHLDISKVYEKANYPKNVLGYLFFRKKIIIKPDSMLHKIAGSTELMVNSIHSQSIDKVGEGLEITSREPNGIIQSIEKPGHIFYMGVQFHPERLIYKRVF
ncbi:MAG: gamma-glutamyl-gamma-aminobutyrate hydrolase family protein [Bacteroidales bacterium]|nr:gamma-glutamyl-gamma-aminobutyrate hydrolase family protein [Bacteroidales bacterium]